MQGRGNRDIPEKTRRPAASSGTIPTCENQGVNPPGIEPDSSRLYKLQVCEGKGCLDRFPFPFCSLPVEGRQRGTMQRIVCRRRIKSFYKHYVGLCIYKSLTHTETWSSGAGSVRQMSVYGFTVPFPRMHAGCVIRCGKGLTIARFVCDVKLLSGDSDCRAPTLRCGRHLSCQQQLGQPRLLPRWSSRLAGEDNWRPRTLPALLLTHAGQPQQTTPAHTSTADIQDESHNSCDLNSRLDELPNLWARFDEIQLILELDDEDTDNSEQRDEFETMFHGVKVQLGTLWTKRNAGNKTTNGKQLLIPNHSYLHLPAVNLPTFTATSQPGPTKARDLVLLRTQHLKARQVSTFKHAHTFVATNGNQCPFCDENHSLHRCDLIAQASVYWRYECMVQHNLCFICLRASHHSSKCRSSNCRRCNKRHHTLLHHETKEAQQDQNDTVTDIGDNSETHQSATHKADIIPRTSVKVRDAREVLDASSGLIDSASQNNFITDSFAKSLYLRRSHGRMSIQGISDVRAQATHRINIELHSHTINFKPNINCAALHKITDHVPAVSIDTQSTQSKDKIQCEEHFRIHTTREPSDRLIVRLPSIEGGLQLGNSYEHAFRRLQQLEFTYGIASAPFFATRCLQQITEDDNHWYPHTVRALRSDFCVDDAVCRVEMLEEALHLQQQFIELLNIGGFTIREFCSNHPAMLEVIPPENRECNLPRIFNDSDEVKALGLLWQPFTDTLNIAHNDRISPVSSTNVNRMVVTKCKALSTDASIFDPMGLISPAVISYKMFLHQIWSHKLGSDEPLPVELSSQRQGLCTKLPAIKDIQVERHVLAKGTLCDIKYHGFLDASEVAYEFRTSSRQHMVATGDTYNRKTPVNLISGGIDPHTLCHSHLWSHCPTWLLHKPDEWPSIMIQVQEGQLPEQRTLVMSVVAP
ncbi:hypothetical protein PR048_007251 [Dryococelus australis]|uniref:Uncharacterized protein n=1 Tax=Dryococelus australis TaxID=614101 RepID=A0ABQ9ID18_9NEOP|nr:hypothetical protein PR048_007251 [Dryococelus australis]